MLQFLKKYSYDIVKLMLSQVALAIFALVMVMTTSQMSANITVGVCSFSILFYLYLIYIIMKDMGAKDRPAFEGGRAKPFWLKGLWISIAANIINIICAIMIFVFSFFIVYQQPVAVYNDAGEKVELYYKEDGSEDVTALKQECLLSDSGDDVFTYKDSSLKNHTTEVVVEYNNMDLNICDKDGNELLLYSKSGDTINYTNDPTRTLLKDNWAHDWYATPVVIMTFFNAMYSQIFLTLFGAANWFYLLMPLPAIAFCTLGYVLGLSGKRILFFLPELKESKKKRMKY